MQAEENRGKSRDKKDENCREKGMPFNQLKVLGGKLELEPRILLSTWHKIKRACCLKQVEEWA